MNNKGLPESLILLRAKLFCKAEDEPKFRFYSLYGHVIKPETLRSAYTRVKKNGGASGLDGTGFRDIEKGEGGVEGFLANLGKELREKSYKPSPVKRVYIPKPDGRLRPLGIPTIKDRVVQQAVLLILEPIFEADFLDSSYGFRPKRNAHDAVMKVRSHLKSGKRVVYEADLKGYFDSIPHDNLIKAVEVRIADSSVLRLIRMWLKSVIVEKDENGRKRVTRSKAGTPQGGVISPLLANIYLHHFDKAVDKAGKKLKAAIVRYADDFIILMERPLTELIESLETLLESRFKLTINREKTRWNDLRRIGNTFDFLGYSFRYEMSQRFNKACLSYFPSKKSEKRIREKIKEKLSHKNGYRKITDIVEDLNQILTGWSNYFSLGYKVKVYSNINYYLDVRFWKYCTRKSQRKMKLPDHCGTWHSFAKEKGLKYLSYGSNEE